MLYNNLYDPRAPLINAKKVVEASASAFADLPPALRTLLANRSPKASLMPRISVKFDTKELLEKYAKLKNCLDEKTNLVTMPIINGKTITELDTLYVGAHTWEGGGREVFTPCSLFIRTLVYRVGFTYAELLASSHCYLTEAKWAACFEVSFSHAVDAATPEATIIDEVQIATKACFFHKQDCDLRLWLHRFGDHLASLVGGRTIASLVSLGSTSGSWVATTSAAVADPKPVAGYTSAALGYPRGWRAHMEACSSPATGPASICLKHQSIFQSFQPHVLQDVSWQLIAGTLSVVVLIFKFELRIALGFGYFQPPAEWISRLCLASGTIAVLIDFQIPIYAWQNGSRWSLVHASLMLLLEIAFLVPRFVWHDLSESSAIWQFWLTDACVWLHCLLSALFSVHLSKACEYPFVGWFWLSAWLFAFASCGAGYLGPIPAKQLYVDPLPVALGTPASAGK